MDHRQLVKHSKFLALHLRHAPERLGLTLQPGGWVLVDDLLAACARHGHPMTLAELREVVQGNSKQRFSFDSAQRSGAPSSETAGDEPGARIRANQGHSVEVDLQLTPQEPPALLYHGTAEQNVDGIQRHGLRRMARHHVHLSPDTDTAWAVGHRHGRPVVFAVDAAAMHQRGYCFFCSANGVWLTDEVPPEFLRRLPSIGS